MGKLWAGHGTKIMGVIVVLLSAVGALNADQLEAMFGKAWAPFIALMVAGLLTLLRGFQGPAQNPKPQYIASPDNMGPGPWLPMSKADAEDIAQWQAKRQPEQKGFVDFELTVAVALFCLVLVGCGLLDVTRNLSIDAKIAAAKQTVASIEQTSAGAVKNGSMSSATGQQVYDSAQNAVQFLNAAHTAVVSGNDTEAQSQYQLANQVLGALQDYVNTHLPKEK